MNMEVYDPAKRYVEKWSDVVTHGLLGFSPEETHAVIQESGETYVGVLAAGVPDVMACQVALRALMSPGNDFSGGAGVVGVRAGEEFIRSN